MMYAKHFGFNELTNSIDHPELVPKNRVDAVEHKEMGAKLSNLLESIRHILGDEPMTVSSGFRNDELNTAVKSKVPTSSHTRFEAADVQHSELSTITAFNVIKRAYGEGLLPNLRKVIIEGVEGKNWLHIEVATFVGDFKGFLATNDGTNYKRIA